MTKKYGKNSFQKSWKTILSHHEQQSSANQEEKNNSRHNLSRRFI